MRETDLFVPLSRWLEGQGYSVSAEVGHCDIVARPGSDFDSASSADADADDPADLIVVEMKVRMSLDLVVQAALRKELTEAVYVAVAVTGSRGHLRNTKGVLALLRRLEVGLLLVRFLRSGTRIEVVLHPRPFTRRRAHRRRARIIREIDGRYAELDQGGLPGSVPRMSAWRQRSIRVARLLLQEGECSPRGLRELGAPEETQRILSTNSYGWFERVSRGVYRLAPEGEQALENYHRTR